MNDTRAGAMTRRLAVVFAALHVLLVLSMSFPADASTRYDPRLRFRTISTSRFDIHFHQGEERLARRLASFAEAAAADVDRAVGSAVGRVQVILVDQNDLSNGWATPLPYNTIEISVAAPAAESSIGNTDDWLRLVFTHEYTHIAHLSQARGWIGSLRRGFGRMPLLFPNLFQPVWGIEGLATWQESAATGQGRVHAGDFRQLLASAERGGRFAPLDRASGGNVDWPGGDIPYLYGAYFHQFLADRYGRDTIARLVTATAGRLPYLTSPAYKQVFGKSIGDLWDEFQAAVRDEDARAVAAGADGARQITHHGFDVTGPRFARDGRLFYSMANPHGFPALMELSADGATRRVADRYLGNRIGVTGDLLVVDEVDVRASVALQSDIYAVDPRTGGRRRLTRGARASDPDVSASGRVVCAVQTRDGRVLATFDLPAAGVAVPVTLAAEADADFSTPRWSPDGRVVAAERRRLGGAADIVLVDVASRVVRTLATLPGGRSGSPAWTPDGRFVLFSAALPGRPFGVFRVDVASGAIAALPLSGSAQSPEVSPDNRRLVYVGLTPDGYDLFERSLTDAAWTPMNAAPAPAPAAPLQLAAENGSAYSPWPTLLPRFWTPTAESDAGEIVVGAATGSLDALGRHAYAAEAGWTNRRRPDWQVAYAYDRWRPTIFADISDDTDPWRGGEVRSVDVNVGAVIRSRRVRSSHATLVAFHAGQDTFACASCLPPVDARQRTDSVRLGWNFSNARAFGYSVSAEEGGRVAVSVEAPRRALGADGNGFAATADVRGYRRAGPRHAAIAARVAAASSWGDDEALRLFSAAGSGPASGGFNFGHDAIGLLRGFDEDDVAGTHAIAANVDYRVPLMRIDRGIGTLPVFFRVLHGAAFADLGHAWTDRFEWSDRRVAIGAEISADAVVGYALPLTFSAGVAWRHDGTRQVSGPAVFGRIGRAF